MEESLFSKWGKALLAAMLVVMLVFPMASVAFAEGDTTGESAAELAETEPAAPVVMMAEGNEAEASVLDAEEQVVPPAWWPATPEQFVSWVTPTKAQLEEWVKAHPTTKYALLTPEEIFRPLWESNAFSFGRGAKVPVLMVSPCPAGRYCDGWLFSAWARAQYGRKVVAKGSGAIGGYLGLWSGATIRPEDFLAEDLYEVWVNFRGFGPELIQPTIQSVGAGAAPAVEPAAPITPTGGMTVTVTINEDVTAVNLRTGPSTKYPVAETVKGGGTFVAKATNEKATWLESETGRYWVAAALTDYAELDVVLPVETNIPKLPEAAKPPAAPPAKPAEEPAVVETLPDGWTYSLEQALKDYGVAKEAVKWEQIPGEKNGWRVTPKSGETFQIVIPKCAKPSVDVTGIDAAGNSPLTWGFSGAVKSADLRMLVAICPAPAE